MKPAGDQNELKMADRIAYLIAGHLQGTLTEEEGAELDAWITESDENLATFEKLTDEENLEKAITGYKNIQQGKAAAWHNIQQTIKKDRRTFKPWPWLVAASFLLVAVTVYLLLPKNKPSSEKPLSHVSVQQPLPAGTDRAVLTLSDGRTLILDSTGKGLLASEGSISINQTSGGQLQYAGTETAMRYNTVSTPRGGQFRVVLGDGTTVWLNADSYLKFPAGFNGAQRKVELKGEAYFEVAKDPAHPFIVNIITTNGNEQSVEVLGTHFNINAYEDEALIKTTLVEGLVKINCNGSAKLLHPGEQAVVTDPSNNTASVTISPTDPDEALAWKNGKFLFRNATILSIGRQLERWYDVNVEYRGTITGHFNTEADRSLPLQKLLKALEGTNEVEFTLQGRKLIIKP